MNVTRLWFADRRCKARLPARGVFASVCKYLQVLRALILDKFRQNALRSAFRPRAGYGQTARTV